MNKNETPASVVPEAKITQPMGPHEKGDQALIDAAHRLPVGEYLVAGANDEAPIRTYKHDTPGKIVATVETAMPGGGTERAHTLINKNVYPVNKAVNAEMAEWPAGKHTGRIIASATGSRVQVDGHSLALTSPEARAEAQAIKAETARKIDAASQQLGHDAVLGTRRAA